MLLSGLAADIACFTGENGAFEDRFGICEALPRLPRANWSFSVEIGLREAFGHPEALLGAVAAFRERMLAPRLFTTGQLFTDARGASSELEELARAGVQQVMLRLDEADAAALSSTSLEILIDACRDANIDARLQFELEHDFTEDICRVARIVEDRQFALTIMPRRVRPRRRALLEEDARLAPGERLRLVIHPGGDVLLERRTDGAIIEWFAGNAAEERLDRLVANARDLLTRTSPVLCSATTHSS